MENTPRKAPVRKTGTASAAQRPTAAKPAAKRTPARPGAGAKRTPTAAKPAAKRTPARPGSGANRSTSSARPAAKRPASAAKTVARRTASAKRTAAMSSNARWQRFWRRLKSLKHMFIFPLLFLYLEIITRIDGHYGVFRRLLFPMLFGFSFGALLSALTSVFKRRVNRIITMLLMYVSGLIYAVEILLKREYGVFFTFNEITHETGNVTDVFLGAFISSALKGLPIIILCLLPAILYTIFGEKKLRATRKKPICAIVAAGTSVALFLLSLLCVNISSVAETYNRQYRFDTAVMDFGVLTGLRLETKYSVLKMGRNDGFVLVDNTPAEETAAPDTAPDAQAMAYGKHAFDDSYFAPALNSSNATVRSMTEYVLSQTPSSENRYTGLFEGKNLILVCAEAMSDCAISPELTPTLYRMMHNGFYFSNYYQPYWGGSTTTGEFSFLLGLAPQRGTTTMREMTDANDCSTTVPAQLQQEGYTTIAFHNGKYDFYDRNLTHPNLGFESFIARGNGLEDTVSGTLKQGYGYLDSDTIVGTFDLYANKTPFCIYYMTLSGHYEFEATKPLTLENLNKVMEVFPDKYKYDKTNYYICYQMELEKAMRILLEDLESAGLLEDTVIAFTGDHYPYPLRSKTPDGATTYLADLYGYQPAHSWERDHNAGFIWSAALENDLKDYATEITAPVFSLDFVPTLYNLFGIDFDSRLFPGRDVLSDAEAIVFWNYYSWVTDKGMYDAEEKKFYPLEGVTDDPAYVERINTIVANKLKFSDSVIDTNYYGVLNQR